MDYSTLNDDKINQLIAKAVGLRVALIDYVMPDGSIAVLNSSSSAARLLVNYCTCPKDTMPLIIKNNISILAPSFFEDELSGWGACSEVDHSVIYRSSNPLRAAAIMFLIMNEESKAQKMA